MICFSTNRRQDSHKLKIYYYCSHNSTRQDNVIHKYEFQLKKNEYEGNSCPINGPSIK